MSRRKKNAGEGYGYMFHGAFGKKADAVAKEKKTKGAWVKGFFTKDGQHRYAVMSPRTNPIKRKKKSYERKIFDTSTAKGIRDAERYKARLERKYESVSVHSMGLNRVVIIGMRSGGVGGDVVPITKNPHELLVMGANPHPAGEQEITLPPGATIVIRTPRTSHESRQNVELGTYEDGLFHPWTRRPRTRQKKAIRRQNPLAADLREEFIGEEPEYIDSSNEPHIPKGDYAKLGDVMGFTVKPVSGAPVSAICYFRGEFLSLKDAAGELLPLIDAPWLISDETARQMYFYGGNQDVSQSLASFGARDVGKGVYELGEMREIVYRARKWTDDQEVKNYIHALGEETGERPTVLFDSKIKRLLIEGGDYEVRREGITN